MLKLQEKLNDQIRRHSLENEVEIMVLRDDGRLTIGRKRNILLEQAGGRFVVSIDDDDDISNDYVRLVTDALRRQPEADCIGMTGQVTFRGRHPHTLVYSLRYQECRTADGIYLRPPQHITPIRREIALRYKFADTSYSEDYDWAGQMRRDHALQREYFIHEVVYYYRSRRSWIWQWLLDRTESLRHRLGLRLVNRLRVRRRLIELLTSKGGAESARK